MLYNERMINEEYLTRTIDWKGLFDEKTLEEAKQLLNARRFKNFTFSPSSAKATVQDLSGRTSYQVTVGGAPASYSDSWESRAFRCSCPHRSSFYYGQRVSPCAHKALVLMLWEKGHGPWTFRESEEEHAYRLLREQEREERDRREALKAETRNIPESPLKILPPKKQGDRIPFFDLHKLLEKERTSLYALTRAEELLKAGEASLSSAELSYHSSGAQCLDVTGVTTDILEECRVRLTLLMDGLDEVRCSCSDAWHYGLTYYADPAQHKRELCGHVLAVCRLLADHLQKEDPGDATDRAAERLFSAFQNITEAKEISEEGKTEERQRTLVLTPLIQISGDDPLLSFRIGRTGAKAYLLKNPRALINAYEDGGSLSVGKNLTADFSREDFTEESMPWLTFLRQRISETDDVNERLNARSRFYYGTTLSVSNKETLTGTYLDRFYTLTEGKSVEAGASGRGGTKNIQVGHVSPRITLKAEALTKEDGEVIGLAVRGEMPIILNGALDLYFLDAAHLSRSTAEEVEAIYPLAAAANGSRKLLFRVGKTGLSEYYYRILPELLANPYVFYEDSNAGPLEEILPPEAIFSFRLSYDRDQDILCKAMVSYEDREYPLWLPPGEGEYHDIRQEERVKEALGKYFALSPEGYTADGDEDTLYRILTEGVSELSRFGEVRGTKEFRLELVRPAPSMGVGVSVESGLMELSLLSEDLKEEELLAIWNSYRLKKKYYRLGSGEFVSLTNAPQLDSFDALAGSLELSPEELMGHSVKLPLYRALYLNKMLEAHDELSADRDKTYRRLINSFNTIRDGEYESPSELSGTLRPYQLYGYKWLRTLDAAGFGGILADEMGLGKTVQMIAHLEALREENTLTLSLVVCPAALIYNWQEEFSRFAPALKTAVAAGGIKERRALYQSLKEKKKENPLVLITGYELLRKDIAWYEPLSFHTMVLDEAQHIKNMKAAVTKAVKVIKASHHFALTGTPIENRLSELWSIFDFLMPGFFYRHEEFQRRFETPITKNKEEAATRRLKDMVSPFLLRRLKTDVLKDLPPKLEEVRYARFAEEQRKLYDAQVVRLRSMLGSMAGGGSQAGKEKIEIFAELMRIRQICCDPSLVFENYNGESAKREACLTLAESAIEGGHRMLIFSQFASMLELLEKDLQERGISCFMLTGKTPKEKRLTMVHSFNEGSCPVFLISLKAGGTGLNLTGADIVIHYDPWWNLAVQNQATDRAHRIGQTKQVTVYKIIVKDTIEEKILKMQEAKKDLAEAVLSGEESSLFRLSAEELMDLL